jgi:hypothetical protein
MMVDDDGGYHYRLAAPAIIQNVNKPAIIRT